MRSAMLEHWWQARQAGRELVPTLACNEQARALNQRARARLVDAGLVDDQRVVHTSRGERVGVGDQIQTRQNERRLRTDTGAWVKNRHRWLVERVADGSLVVRGRGGRVTLPADYAQEHVELAYFQTVHSSQGLTRNEAATLIDELSGWRSVYVGMTRGRHTNTAYVVVDDPDDNARQVLERALRRDRADLGALAIQRQLADDARRITKRRVHELEAEQQRLTTSADQHDLDRLRAVDQELEQLAAVRRPQTPAASPRIARPRLLKHPSLTNRR